MFTNAEIRRNNLKILVDEVGGVGRLAELLGKSDSQVSQWMNASAHSKTGKGRGMRPDSARLIEAKCGKPLGWMDIQHHKDAAEGEQENLEIDEDERAILRLAFDLESRHPSSMLANLILDFNRLNPKNKILSFNFVDNALREQRKIRSA